MVQGDRFIANPSLAHTVGNVTFKMTNVLKNLFGPNFFKHVHIDTRMAYTDFAKFINSRKEFIKKNKPILGIRPSVDITNDDIFLAFVLGVYVNRPAVLNSQVRVKSI